MLLQGLESQQGVSFTDLPSFPSDFLRSQYGILKIRGMQLPISVGRYDMYLLSRNMTF